MIAGFVTPKMASAAQAGNDTRLIDLRSRYRELDPVIEAAERRQQAAVYRLVAMIGECPKTCIGESARRRTEWHAAYRQSGTWVLEDEAQAVRDRQCRIIDEIERMAAITIVRVVAKLELWNEPHERYLDDNETLVISAIDDLKALS